MKQRELEQLLMRVEAALEKSDEKGKSSARTEKHRQRSFSSLDHFPEVIAATRDLRLDNGNLSAERIGKLYGVSMSELARLLGRSRQALGKTPDADSLQPELACFERIARLRLLMKSDSEFRKWLKMPQELLNQQSPLDLLMKRERQVLVDFVEDALTGAPS